jgi:hypothetical protein
MGTFLCSQACGLSSLQADEPETREALDLIFNDHFSRNEPGIFEPIRQMLLHRGDYYMHLADLNSYLETQGRVSALYADPNAWSMRAIITSLAPAVSPATVPSGNMRLRFGTPNHLPWIKKSKIDITAFCMKQFNVYPIRVGLNNIRKNRNACRKDDTTYAY